MRFRYNTRYRVLSFRTARQWLAYGYWFPSSKYLCCTES